MVIIKLANGAMKEIRIDYPSTLLLYGTTLVKEWGIIFGILNQVADGNATILMLECPLVIFGKYSFARWKLDKSRSP